MNTNFIEYDFNTDTVSYPSNYNSTKLNLGHLMVKNTDENGITYVSPIEPRFMRGYEVVRQTPFSFVSQISSLGFLKYNSDISWVFYTTGDIVNGAKRIFLSTYTKSINQFDMIGSINVNASNNTGHQCAAITPSMEYHTGGTVSVNSTSVSGNGTTWLTDGVCSGNRIGFGSTSSSGITKWYRITSVVSNTSLVISREYENDGFTNGLIFSSGTTYVIEDFRLIYANYGQGVGAATGVILVKGLRYENFTISPITIPAATTIDNLRAGYRIINVTGTTSTIAFIGLILENKTSFTQQDLFTLSFPSVGLSSIQKFNIRASLTLSSGNSNSPFLFTTGNQAHNGTNITIGWNPFIKGVNGNYFITTLTRLVRIIPANIVLGSTTFISDSMVELPPGSATTFSVSSSLVSSHYLPLAQRFYIPNTTATRNYVTPYISGSTTPFERVVLTNDQVQATTYTLLQITTPTSNYIGQIIRSYYHDGLSYLIRDVGTDNNVIYTLPIEADKQYHTTSNACIITPQFLTPSATSYNKIYVNAKTYFNDDNRFIVPRENYDIYYRTTGITTDTGSWTLINQNGSMSGVTGTSIQFKLAFSTIGHTCVPSLIYGIGMSYNSDAPPPSIPFYEPSLKFTDKSSQVFTWRQNSLFSVGAPAVMIDIYDSSNNLLLSDDVSVQSGGTFQYSSDDGVTWNNWSYSANSVGNYLRYSSSTLSASGLIVKPILFPATPTPTASFIPTPTPTNTPTPTPTPTIDANATAFISAAGITATTQQSAINQLVIDLKNYGLWTKLEAVYPFVGGTANSHKFNLKNPLDTNAAFRLSFSGTWVHSSTGVLGNGTNAWANTFYNLSTNSTSTNISAGVYCRTNLQFAGVSFGAENSSTSVGTVLALKWTDTNTYYSVNDNLSVGTFTTLTDTRGLFAISRLTDTITTKAIYRNGSLLNSITASSPGVENLEMAFNARNRSGSITSYDNREYAFFFIGDNLTDVEHNTLYLAVQAYQTRLGRQV